uniref:BRCT domain-containing protein n=1 Tax=Caenorhabditis japonica TaxID=281687 RepID=A0A8R1DF30_CAEJA
MESANSTMEVDGGNTTTEQVSIPSTTSVLDKSRSLFGNSSVTLSTTVRDPTPDVPDGEARAPVIETSMVIETEEMPVQSEPPLPEKEKQDEPMDTSEASAPENLGENLPEEEEVFERKVISMDTTGDATEASVEPLEREEVGENEGKEENGDEKVEEEEADGEEVEDEEENDDEVPKKKAKRAASTSEDDLDDTQEDSKEASKEPQQSDVSVEPEDKISSSEAVVGEETAEEQTDDTNSLQMDEPADTTAEEVQTENETPQEEGEEESSSLSTRRPRRSAVAAAAALSSPTPKRAARGRPSKIEEQQEKAGTSSKRGRRSLRSSKNDQDVSEEVEENEDEETQETEEDPEEEEVVEEPSPKKGRGRRSAAASAPNQEDPTTNDTPKRAGRGRRSAAAATPASTKPTPKSTRRGRKSNAELAKDEEQTGEEDGAEATEELTSPTRKSTRTPRGRKSAADVNEETQDDEEQTDEQETDETPTTSSRRSTRAKQSNASTPVTPAAKRRKKQAEDVAEEVDETVETPVKKGRAAPKSAANSSKKKDEYDPYDLDTEIEHHPEPLKNIQEIQMEVQNFGAVKYAKVGASESKYAMTEKTAESRISELQSSSATKNRRSLADMTPGKEKVKHRMSYAPTPGRKPAAKKEEVEDDDTPTSSTTPVSTPSNRGKKRKSEAAEAQSAKKQAQDLTKKLNDEEQLVVDHPQDENEPFAPGARVYAVFQKMFYPAVILTERDGLGRYKLQFVTDKVVKDVPSAGVIPLRAVLKGKTAIYDEEEVFVDHGPDDISAEIWAKGKVGIRDLDDENEPSNELKIVDWVELSFEPSEWRDYIKEKEISATAIVASNITSMSEVSRSRKPAAPREIPNSSRIRKARNVEDLASSRGASASPFDDEELLKMNEKSVGKNIFEGRVFMITSASRSNSSQVAPMLRKKNLLEFIKRNGGVVTEQITSFQERYPGSVVMLISDTYYRTHKYLAALAQGVPCVHNRWLQACAEKGEIVDHTDFLLPAGSSLFNEEVMPAPSDPSKLLAGKTIFVHSILTTREITQAGPGGTFAEIWSPMLQALGATVLECDWEKLEESEIKFDVVLVDGTFRDEVLEYAKSIGADAVTSEWVIQTIILNEAPAANTHPKFDPYRLHHRGRSP